MNLKESYTYMNFLKNMITTAEYKLADNSFVTTTTENHFINDANPTAKDKTVVIPKTITGFTPMQVINLLVKLVEEKDKLSEAIVNAKKELDFDIDNSMSMNKTRNSVVNVLTNLSKIENSEKEVNKNGYRINETSGSQECFTYVCNVRKEIDFDRNDVRKLIKKYKDINRELSNKKDLLELTTMVDFTPAFDMDESFNEIVVEF